MKLKEPVRPQDTEEAIRLLATVLERKRSYGFLTWMERLQALWALQCIPPAVCVSCTLCAQEKKWAPRLQGIDWCCAHVRELIGAVELEAIFERKEEPGRLSSLAPTEFRRGLLHSKKKALHALLERKRMGGPLSVEEKNWAHHAVNTLPLNGTCACEACVSDWEEKPCPVVEGFAKCRDHLHSEINTKVEMT